MSEMKEQPLWVDISSHNGDLDFTKIIANAYGVDKVWGIISRAGYGQDGGYYDQKFQQNWLASERFDYRSSYWAYWDWFPLMHQLDMWFKANPTLGVGNKNIAIPRVWDLEKELAHPSWTSDETWRASDIVLARDGHRFIIYSREDILERTLCKYWSEEQLNEHYYILAQYDHNDPTNPPCTEYNGIRVPLGIRPERILWKQTTSCMTIYPGSGYVDRDRWIWTDAETMHDDIQEFWGEPEPPPVDCCEDLDTRLTKVENQLPGLWNHVEQAEEDLVPRIERLELDLKELDELEIEEQLDGLQWGVESLRKMNEATNEQVSLFEQATEEALEDINARIDGLAGGHDHPKWMKVLGWVK